MALGLFIPPLWIGNVEDKEDIALPGLMFFYFFTAAIVVALFVFLFPKEEPVGLTIRRNRAESISMTDFRRIQRHFREQKQSRFYVRHHMVGYHDGVWLCTVDRTAKLVRSSCIRRDNWCARISSKFCAALLEST